MGMVSHSPDRDLNNPYLCSVCIANYNGEKFLDECIDSILLQEGFQGAIEIIVHDDASTDGTRDILEDYAARYPNIFHLILQETISEKKTQLVRIQ